MTSKEKYLKRIAEQETDAIKEAKERVENRSWLRASKKLALKILIRLDELEWTQRTLSLELGVTPQYVNKLLKGNEKFGFDILVKLQNVLSMPIFIDLETPKESSNKKIKTEGELIILDFCKSVGSEPKISPHTYAKVVSINYNEEFYEYSDVKEN